MAIYEPTPRFSESDKRLLMLLGRLLLETKFGKEATSSNIQYRSAPLTDSEAAELSSRVEQLVDSREFLEATHFVEALTLPDRNEESVARGIYLAIDSGEDAAVSKLHLAGLNSGHD